MNGPLLRHGPLKSNVYTPHHLFDTQHYYRLQRSVMQQQQQQQQQQQYRSWKKNPPFLFYQPERPHSDDFLFLEDNNGGPQLLSVVFPICTTNTKVHLSDIKASPLPLTVTPFSSIYYRDPLVTTSKTPVLDSSNRNKRKVINQSTYLDQKHLPSTVYHYTQQNYSIQRQSRSQKRHQEVYLVPHHQQPSTISHQSSHRGTAQPNNFDNHSLIHSSPPISCSDNSSVGINGRASHSSYQNQHKSHHRYHDSTLDDSYSDEGNHRRISNNTYTSTSTRSSSAPRRFSSSSTSSKSTLASSIGSISHWNNHDPTLAIDVIKQDRCSSLPINDAQTTIVRTAPINKSMDTGLLDDQSSDRVHDADQQQQQQQQTLSSSTSHIPIWADPIKVRDNPTKYEVIQEYMTIHQIPNSSHLPLHRPIVFYTSGGTTTTSNYRSHLQILFTSDTMWNFSSRWKHHKDQYAPSRLAIHQTIYCFQKGVEPMWEDKVNKNGGRLTLVLTNTLEEDDLFDWMICAFIGGNLVLNGCVGLVFSKRARADRIELWLDASSSGHHDRITSLRAKFLGLFPTDYHPLVLASRYKKHYGD